LPAIWGSELPIVVVGAVDEDGERTWYSQGFNYELSTSAVGNVECPDARGDGTQELRGTSFGMT
jgi:hypothetical protein